MKTIKRIISITMIIALLASICIVSTISYGASGTGAGLAEWCLNAYNSGWSYVYGGATPGAVDCSGLIYSYAGGHRTGDAQLYNSSYVGNVSNGVPRIHGLGLWQPGHVGVYVGDGMAVDARGSQYGVCYQSVYTKSWTKYFKVPGVSYPTNGFVTFNGSKYYYENGQYVVNTTRTIDGVSYSFNSSGKCTTTSGSSTSSNSSSSSSSSSSTTLLSSTLRNGSTGDKVVKLQERLQELGYYTGAIDGKFGDGTEEAFKLFQKTAGLYVDGLAGSDVDLLYSDDAPEYIPQAELVVNNDKSEDEIAQTAAENDEIETETPNLFKNGDFHEEIIKIQERLIELNYYSGTADGSFGSMTEEAVTAFQKANGIEQSGEANEYTMNVLFSEDAVKNPVSIEEDPTEKLEVVDSELPESALNANPTVIKAGEEVVATEIALETNKLSQKALAGIADTMSFEADSNGNNFQFIFWLAVMILVMSVTFAIVNAKEKKKYGKRTSSKYF
ncbi:MAG: peptidoglycan-binding protein [Ruminococcus sp.]|nr:peptidoglycan-binding protein [Ruminococcus sp.]